MASAAVVRFQLHILVEGGGVWVKTTRAGCGQHVNQVKATVPADL